MPGSSVGDSVGVSVGVAVAVGEGVASAPEEVTSITPVSEGCIEQWYGYVPGSSKECEKVWHWLSGPESNRPISEVTVCSTVSLFLQITGASSTISTVPKPVAPSGISTTNPPMATSGGNSQAVGVGDGEGV